MVLYHSSLVLLSRLECQRRIWFVQNAGLTVFHHHNASLWGRDFSSLYADIKALGRLIMKNFRHRDTIIYVHAKIIDGTCLYLLYNLIVHRTSSFLKVLCGCILSFAVSSHHVEDIVCDASGLSKRCTRQKASSLAMAHRADEQLLRQSAGNQNQRGCVRAPLCYNC